MPGTYISSEIKQITCASICVKRSLCQCTVSVYLIWFVCQETEVGSPGVPWFHYPPFPYLPCAPTKPKQSLIPIPSFLLSSFYALICAIHLDGLFPPLPINILLSCQSPTQRPTSPWIPLCHSSQHLLLAPQSPFSFFLLLFQDIYPRHLTTLL